jgi:uncharacterized surface protein with fasciclin (FAS1) repeats
MSRQLRLAGLAVLAAGLATAGCGVSPGPSATPTGTGPPPGARTVPAHQGSGTVGAGCAMIPAHGAGNLRSLGSRPALGAAASNPQLSVFASAVRSAGLTGTLNSGHAATIIIPANSAFAGLTAAGIARLRNHRELRRIVTYQATGRAITPAQFAAGTSPATLEGSTLRLSRAGRDYKVNGATVLCGNIKTAGASLYIVSKVLLPPG